MKEGSMIEAATAALTANGKEMKFQDLWAKVRQALEITQEEEADRIGHFYTDISLNGKFVVLANNTWDLRARHKYDAVHIDVKDVYSEVEQSDGDAEDLAEEKAYNESVQGGITTSEEDEGADEDEEKPAGESAAELLGIKDGF